MCTTDAQCSSGERCITSPISIGNSKSLYCELTSPYWIALLSYFRQGVKSYATFQCNSSIPLGNGTLGSCYISVWRLEPNATWFDPFFYCTAQNCSLVVKNQVVTPPTAHVPENATTIRYVGMAVIYALLLLVILNGLIDSKKSHGRVRRFASLSILISIVLGGYIVFCMEYGHTDTPPAQEELVAEYECLHSKCECAPDPPLHLNYDPHCKGSTMDMFFFPYMVDKLKVICTMDGQCKLEHENLGYAPIPLQCQAAECTSSNITVPVIAVPEPTSSNNNLILWVAIGCVVALGLFVWHSINSARKLAKDFYSRFENSTASSALEINSSSGARISSGVKTPLLAESSIESKRMSSVVHDESSTLLGDCEEIQLDLQDGGYCVKGKEILREASLSFRSGEMVAIMGASGAGKTTLLDILSKRDKQGVVSGVLSVNGETVGQENESTYKRLVGFVAQTDNLIPALTVRETIEFAAKLKLPAAIPADVIAELVDDVIEKLHLGRCANTPVGSDSSRGVSGGEKRRVSIATELVANPRILFLDEPTSGLDSVSATEVMRAISNLSRASQIRRFRKYFELRPAVIFSIHQPSTEIFALFDRLVVVSQGRITYSGRAKDALRAMSATAGISGTPSSLNDAESILRLDYEATPETFERLTLAVEKPQPFISKNAQACSIIEQMRRNKKYYPNVVQQFVLLSKRTWCSLMGSYYLIMCHAFATLFLGIMLSLLYQKEKLDLAGTEDKAGMVTFLLLVVGFSSISSLDLFISEKKLYVIERDNGYYRSGAYYITKVLFDFVPLRIFPAAILGAVTYYPMGLRQDSGTYFFSFVAILVVFQLFVTGICLCVATLAPTFGAGALYSALIILWHSAFGGLMMQSSTIPNGFVWCKYLSPFYFAYEALMINELNGLGCVFDPANAEGNKEGVSVPLPCKQFLYNMGLDPVNFSRDVTALCAWLVVYLVLGAILLHFLRIKV